MTAQKSGRERQLGRRDRGSITPEYLIGGAYTLAEEVGLDNLSMPTLAKYLDIGITSIYWHFRRKDDLLDAMQDRAIAQFASTTWYVGRNDWRASLYAYAKVSWRALCSNPVMCDLILSRERSSETVARHGAADAERAVADLVHAGLTPQDAWDTYNAITIHIRGSLLIRRIYDRQFRTTEVPAERAEDRSAAEGSETASLRRNVPDEHLFEFGLLCILDSAQQRIGARRTGQ
ncbi:TetR/AcrR family transcriptional regulator [Mycobacterium sp. 48b]|uniref:TetR/AcrR family transcriptional regulator n=1 Tax=Mycobacterium sp. 48b TaxID=3400426 RepID=UPI003AAB0B93